jgi:hypothetical protein
LRKKLSVLEEELQEQETFEIHDNITHLQKELGDKMERPSKDMVNLRSDYEIMLQSIDT